MSLTTSVVLCTFNGARFLQAQWDSVLAQSRLPDEIVVRDDASTDATCAMLDGLSRTAKDCGIRVRLTRNAANLGYVANFEAALADAAGDVLLLCDQDDVWRADKLETLVAAFVRQPATLLLCSDARRIDAAGAGLPRSLFDVLKVSKAELRRIHAGEGFGVLLRRSLATGATIALRRSFLADALPVGSGWVHDEWLAIMAAARGGFECIEEPLIDYRQHADNQLGMPERDLAAKWRDLVKPQATLIDALIARDEVLRERLLMLGSSVAADRIARAVDKLRHLRVRRALHGPLWARAASVIRESAAGRYRRYGSGWHMALRDLLRSG